MTDVHPLAEAMHEIGELVSGVVTSIRDAFTPTETQEDYIPMEEP